ncbi:response regulator transcription factor [Geomonas sp. RF6]|uniref:response regulator transcription factor n=1 Tax=Geomonas sp. RF6 TaxID=2897342 RepID=UPI001E51B385|nr:response regulator transcription factor [Geomonas sp. RF6]UFS72536.1 response regulator transcription factor [Geomonas sp. RF6]
MTIKVALVDDHTVVREGLKALLGKAGDIEVIAEAVNGKEAVEKACAAHVVIMDLNMPQMNGIQATTALASKKPEVKVLFLCSAQDRPNVMAALKAGAKGYLGKSCCGDELIDAVRAVHSGNAYFGKNITEVLVEDYRNRVGSDGEGSTIPLSPREQEVLQEIADGRNTKDIAFTLGLSVKTVETHRLRIMKKLDLHSLQDLTKYAIREGISSLW